MEGDEHAHYLHQCHYYGQSTRGGGHSKEDPILTIFKWFYSQIRQNISETSVKNQQKFEAFVESVFAEKELVTQQNTPYANQSDQQQGNDSCSPPSKTNLQSDQQMSANSEQPLANSPVLPGKGL